MLQKDEKLWINSNNRMFDIHYYSIRCRGVYNKELPQFKEVWVDEILPDGKIKVYFWDERSGIINLNTNSSVGKHYFTADREDLLNKVEYNRFIRKDRIKKIF